jgi:hypothetical protein
MKKLLFSVITLFGIGMVSYSQNTTEEILPEFSRAYLNVMLSYGDSVTHYEGANVFTFNVDGNSIMYYPHKGDAERYIYVGSTMEGEDDYGDSYQLIKTIEAVSSDIVYFQLYNDRRYGLNLIYEEPLIIVHFYNKELN